MYESFHRHFTEFMVAEDQLAWSGSHPQCSELEHWIACAQDFLYIDRKYSSKVWGLWVWAFVFLLFLPCKKDHSFTDSETDVLHLARIVLL